MGDWASGCFLTGAARSSQAIISTFRPSRTLPDDPRGECGRHFGPMPRDATTRRCGRVESAFRSMAVSPRDRERNDGSSASQSLHSDRATVTDAHRCRGRFGQPMCTPRDPSSQADFQRKCCSLRSAGAQYGTARKQRAAQESRRYKDIFLIPVGWRERYRSSVAVRRVSRA